MLEIDLALGRRPDFLSRLRRALQAASVLSVPTKNSSSSQKLHSKAKRGMKKEN